MRRTGDAEGEDHVATRQAAEPKIHLMGERRAVQEAPTAIERAARRESARNNAADSKLSDVSSLQVATSADVVAPARVLHRVVMPRPDDPPEVRPLYLDEPETPHRHTAEVTSRSTVTLPP